jgi:hypothetical protein
MLIILSVFFFRYFRVVIRERIMRKATNIERKRLVSMGTCFGKFTKSGKFKLHITALDYLAQYARVYVCSSSIPLPHSTLYTLHSTLYTLALTLIRFPSRINVNNMNSFFVVRYVCLFTVQSVGQTFCRVVLLVWKPCLERWIGSHHREHTSVRFFHFFSQTISSTHF